jgi:hypothetical protein
MSRMHPLDNLITMKYLFIISIILCAGFKPKNFTPVDQAINTMNIVDLQSNKKIGNIIGIIVVNKSYTKKDTIKLFNDNGTLWYKFTFYYDDSDGKFDYPNEDFLPMGFNPDYFVLSLAVINIDSTGYQVIVNNETGLVKRIRKEPYLSFLTLDQYVISAFSISFNNQNTLIHENPSNEAKIIPFVKDIFYHPLKIQGEWLQIKWGMENDWHYGWIKWKDKNTILIEVHLYA